MILSLIMLCTSNYFATLCVYDFHVKVNILDPKLNCSLIKSPKSNPIAIIKVKQSKRESIMPHEFPTDVVISLFLSF